MNLPLFGNHVDDCDPVDDGTFFPDRQVTGRNAPNVVMAIFNRDNFWDGRADQVFDGTVGNDNDGGIWVDNGDGLEQEAVELKPASLASQEVGPPNNEVEMSCLGRTFAQLGEKLLALGLTPLGQQHVASDDSVLGGIANLTTGLGEGYGDMIEAAFNARFWNSLDSVNGHTQKELNFNFFWGIAVMLYGSTLIPDQTPFDLGTMSASATRGQDVFDDAGCDSCHRAPEYTNASIQNGGNGNAFVNTGVRPTADDPGREDGKFKTPTLRNVELTGPYFHNGGQLTLRQVVDFYDRGGDHLNDEIDSAILPLGLSGGEKDDLVEFLLALTDERVRCEKGPFDHSAIEVPNLVPSMIAAVGMGGLDPGNDVNCLEPFLGADPHDE